MSGERRVTLRFLVVGVAAAICQFILTWLLLALAGVTAGLASAMAFGLVFIMAYRLQRGWTFASSASHARTLPRYAVTQLFAAGLGALVAELSWHLLRWPDAAVALASTMASGGLAYVLSSRWVFAR